MNVRDTPQNASHLGLEGLLNYRIQRLASKMTLLTTREVLKKRGIGISEWRLICRLIDSGPQTPTVLAHMLGLDLGRTSRLLKSAETHGLVNRKADKSDRRSFTISLTPKGQLVFEDAWPDACAVAEEFRQLYSPEEAAVLDELLDRAIRHANDRL